MRILLLGKRGQLGWELHRSLAPLGEIIAFQFPQVDLKQPESLREVIREIKPAVILNAAAYTAVDRAESEPEMAYNVNGVAPGIMAEEARRLGSALIHFSTDYVFDGAKGEAYTERDVPNPVNVYGQSKLAGEQAIQEAGGAFLILRTSWVYSLRRESFATRVLEWARKQSTLRIVADQVGSPTWCRMLAEATALVIARGGEDFASWLAERRGVYHLAGWGTASRLEWAQAVIKYDPRREEQIVRAVLPAATADFPTPARRPPVSALACNKFYETFGLRLPDWEEALKLALDRY